MFIFYIHVTFLRTWLGKRNGHDLPCNVKDWEVQVYDGRRNFNILVF